MNIKETEFLKLEDELLNTRKKLNDLIREYYGEDQLHDSQSLQASESKALYQDKIKFLETEMMYLNHQLQLLKHIELEVAKQNLQTDATHSQMMQNAQVVQNMQPQPMQNVQPKPVQNTQPQPQPVQNIQPQPVQNMQPQPMQNVQPQPVQNVQPKPVQNMQPQLQPMQNVQPQPMQNMRPQPYQNMQPQATYGRSARQSQEYEKVFGKNLMGILASVLIFISLIIFATLVLPYLSDTMKLIGLYILSFGILGGGLYLYHKNKNNKFFIAVIACGTGCLYLSLLLSDLYFKVLSDVALYCFILVWAVLVKNLTKVKNLVFQIIGQLGIFIATIMGTALCAGDNDEKKFFVLTIFYLVSSCVFAEIDKAYLKYMIHFRKNADGDQTSIKPPCYEDHIFSHLCKSLNAMVFVIGFAFIGMSGFKTASVLLFMLFLLLEYYLTFRETCRHGFVFQILTIANTLLMIGFFHEAALVPNICSAIFIYLAAIAILIFTEKKNADCKIYTMIFCIILAFVGCYSNEWIREHLYAYLTVIPFLLYGKWKNRKMYLYTGIIYLGGFLMLILDSYNKYAGYRGIEYLVMIVAVCAAFLYICYKSDYVGVKISGYILMCLILINFVSDATYTLIQDGNRANLIAFFVIALVHLLLSKLEYFGTEKSVEGIMVTINALLMIAGCIFMHDMPWQIPTILITVLLFLLNSKRLLSKDKSVGYYVAFKYTVLMISILSSFDAESYIISICLLIFAIVSIVVGFYKDTASFRLYGLILSMISIVKLVLIDIQYDNTLETALSFFVCGVLCFIISFIYHKIDIGFRNKENSDA